MRILIATLCVSALAFASSPLRADDAELLFSDDFTQLKPGWGAADELRMVEAKHLVLTVRPQTFSRILYQPTRFTDADMRVKITPLSSETDQYGGLIFWGVDANEYYAALVKPDGGFYIARRTNGRSIYPVASRVREEVRKGQGQINELRVVTSGPRATIYVNDKEVTSFQGYPPAGGGKIGVFAEAGQIPSQWAFSNLAVRKGPAAATPPAPQDAALLFADNFKTLEPGWGNTSDSFAVADGKFLIKPPLNSVSVFRQNGLVFGDVDIRVQVTETAGGRTQPGGIVFWGQDGNRFYFAGIQADGMASVSVFGQGKRVFPLKKSPFEAIQKGIGALNDLRVITKGATATIFVNGKEIGKVDAPEPPGACLIGLAGESDELPATWAFSNLSVRKPSAADGK